MISMRQSLYFEVFGRLLVKGCYAYTIRCG